MARRNVSFTPDFRALSKQKPASPLPSWVNFSKIFQRPVSSSGKFKGKTNDKNHPKQKNTGDKNNAKNKKTHTESKSAMQRTADIFSWIYKIPLAIVLFIAKPLGLVAIASYDSGKRFVTRSSAIKFVFALIFLSIVLRLAQLQVLGSDARSKVALQAANAGQEIILARRGQIYIEDLSQSKNDVPLTSTQTLSHVFFNPAVLKEQVTKGYLTIDDAANKVAGALNISYPEIDELFRTETNKSEALQYVLIPEAKFIDGSQTKAVEYLRNPNSNPTDEHAPIPFNAWLGLESVDTRLYPEGNLLAATLGYVPKYQETRDEALQAGCNQMVQQNESRGTVNTYIPGDYSKGQYTVGYYGLEQKFCSELAGLNGRKPLNSELGSKQAEEAQAQNGASIFLTVDRNLQRKAEQSLAEAVKINTNSKGGPQDGTVLIMEIKTGKILAMASSPTYDPNDPGHADSRAFRNSVTSGDYEVGSVLKPLTIAMALNEYEAGDKDSQGNRLGVPPDWKFDDFDTKGKPYQENNGNIFYIRNSQNLSFGKNLTLSNVLRDSINTGIAEIQPTVGNRKTKEYFEEKYQFGKPTLIDLPGDANGNVQPLSSNINSDFSYATHGFGQGFTMSPIQLARAYSALGNDGKIVEPYLVDKIVYGNGKVDDGSEAGSIIARPKPYSVFSSNVAHLVSGYMVDVLDQGYRGAVHSKGQVPGYTVSGKTGTSQVARTYNGQPCNYDCNTALGIYDHTFIGFGPTQNPQVLVLIKLSAPKPGDVNNFAENTLGPTFSDLTKYTMEYLGIPKDRK